MKLTWPQRRMFWYQGVAERADCAAPRKGRAVEVMRRCRRENFIVRLYCKPKGAIVR